MVHYHSRTRILVGILLGVMLLGLCVGGVLAADPTVTVTVAIWATVPNPPSNFEITQTALHGVNITWDMGTAANITIIRVSTDGYPFSIFDGNSTYSGNGTWVAVDDLDLNTYTYYFRAWSQNEYGTSTGYAQDSIGNAAEDDTTTTFTITGFSLTGDGFGIVEMLLVVAFLGFAIWKKSWIRVILSICVIIWGAFAMPIDAKIAGPLLAIGSILFIVGIMNLIGQQRVQEV